MKIERLKKRLATSENKLKIFGNKRILSKYKLNDNITLLLHLINDFLSNDEKAKLFEFEHFKKLPIDVKQSIIELISDEDLKLNLILDGNIIENMNKSEILKIISSLNDYGKIIILQNDSFLEKNFLHANIREIVLSLNDENKRNILLNKDFLKKNKRQFTVGMISDIVSSIKDEKIKQEMIDSYKFENYFVVNILKTFSSKSKTKILLENKYEFNKVEIISLVASMNTNFIINLFNNHRDFLNKNNIKPYSITNVLDSKKQLDLLSKFESIELSIRRKKANFSNTEARNKRAC